VRDAPAYARGGALSAHKPYIDKGDSVRSARAGARASLRPASDPDTPDGGPSPGAAIRIQLDGA